MSLDAYVFAAPCKQLHLTGILEPGRGSFGAPPNRPSSEGTFPSAREKQSYFTRQKQSHFTLWIAAEIIRAGAPCSVVWVRC